jgi:hypothetical protein
VKEKITVCSACGHPSAMKMANTGTLTGEGVPPKQFTAKSCVHCHRHFGWSPEPPGLEYGKHYIWVTHEGFRTGKYVWTNDPDQQHLIDETRVAKEIEIEIDVED